jgi:mono/diheme cytochrome c family protein
MRRSFAFILALAAACALPAGPSSAQDDEGSHPSGRALAQRLCATCHAIDSATRSPNPAAPPFARMEPRVDLSELAERLQQGIIAGHPDMPVFVLHDHEARALVAYLRAIQRDGR